MHVEMRYLRAQTCLHLGVHLVASLHQLFCQLHVISRKAIMCPQRKCARQETNQVVLKETGKEEKGATWATWFCQAWGLVFLWEQAYHFRTEVPMGQLSYKCKARRSRLLQQVLLHAFHSQQVVIQQSEKKKWQHKWIFEPVYAYLFVCWQLWFSFNNRPKLFIFCFLILY